jgi:predicted PurR-regulated permease PerM
MAAPPLPAQPPKAVAAERPPRSVRFEVSLKSLFIVLGLLAAVWVVVRALLVLLVLVTALMLVGSLYPLVAWLEQRQVRRTFAICLVFTVGTAFVSTLAVFTVPTVVEQVKALVENEPRIRETVASYLEGSRLTAPLADGLRQVSYTELLKASRVSLFALGVHTAEIVAYLIAAVFLAFYMMLDRDRLRGALFAVVPRAHHIRLSRILLNLGTIVGGYLRGQVITCVLMAGFILVLLLACGVPDALAIAVFGGVMDLLPYIGIFLTMGPAVLAAWGQGPVIAGIVFLLMLAYEELESRVLVPLVYGQALRLPSSLVLFSLIVGTALAGLIGALLALPLAAAVLMLVQELRVELPGQGVEAEDLARQRAAARAEQRDYERRAEGMPVDQAAAIAVEISDERKKAKLAAAHAHPVPREPAKPDSEQAIH